MQVDAKLIVYLEDLTFLTLSDNEKVRMAADLQKILNDVSRLSEVNTDGVPECIHPFDTVNVFREDKVIPSLDREVLLANAPSRNDEMFAAPRTVD
ncbi:MAG: Asp-tRNA(Asn)/Glu-tRNA(Gln) amidotransferase subunit GatC [Treponema sp.]|nr:Asp-tRNA(Asn)/Glu-tRNA(Gln) amidotransferase subunit GatC [Treponema sp.]